jgi:hypothetical protein
MRSRDKQIIADLEEFRVLSRDDIADLYFSDLKFPEKMANHVLKRLWREGYITANTNRSPYVYFLNPAPIKKDSSKINHYLEINRFFRAIKKIEEPSFYKVEANFGKEYAQCDLFLIWQGFALFIEIQRSFYSPKQMQDKLDRYQAYFDSGEWKQEPWQEVTPGFPSVNIISKERYNIERRPFGVNQFQTAEEFIETVNHAVTKRNWKKATIKINNTTQLKNST